MSSETVVKSLPPGPRGGLLSGVADELKHDPLGFLTRCQSEFGNLVPFRAGPYQVLLINEPELIETILVTEAGKFTKDAALRNNPTFFGDGLLRSEGQYWRRQRKLAAPAFSPRRILSYGEVMVEHAVDMIERWQDRQTLDIQHEMMYLTLGIAMKTLFDAELSGENRELEEALTAAQKHLADRMNDPLLLMLPEWIPFPTNVRLNEAIHTVDRFIYSLIAQRRGKSDQGQDLLSILLSVKDETDGTGMTDQQIRDEVFTMFFAGHETTALTLTWTLYLISQHPQVESQLLDELQGVLAGRPPGVSDCASLQFTEKVIRESLRIRPPVWAIGREAASDCVVGGYPVQKGTSILVSQWLMHHDRRFYDQPDSFNPNRWSDQFTQSLPKFAYFPFGGGPRICIGNNFALLESVLLLAAIMQKYHLSTESDQSVGLVPAVTLRPAQSIRMTLNKR